MKPDDFEQSLQRQSLREVPGEWRAEILATAREVQAVRTVPGVANRSWLSTLNSQLSTIFWPHPKAWAGLAAVWVFIVVLNLSTREGTPTQMAEKASPPSPEMIAELRKQQRMFAELMGPHDPVVADRSKTVVPRPRSEREQMVLMSV